MMIWHMKQKYTDVVISSRSAYDSEELYSIQIYGFVEKLDCPQRYFCSNKYYYRRSYREKKTLTNYIIDGC